MKLFLAFLLLPLLQAQALLQAEDSGVIEGTVIDKSTGIGIAEVSVYFGSDNGVSYDATTDTSGRFQVTDVKEGVYGSKYEKTGYVKQYSGTNNSDLKPVRVGREPVQIRIEMQAFGSIRGRVLDPEGKPMAKATVTLGLIMTETTDELGQFAFTKLAPLSYKLKAAPAAGTAPLFAKPGEDRIEVVPTWFPSVPEEDQSEQIVVRSGAEVSNLEIRLRTAPVYRVRGVVLAENGTPQSRAVVHTGPASERSFNFDVVNMGGLRKGTTTGGPLGYFIATPGQALFSGVGLANSNAKDGTFEFPSVPRGQRRFTASIEAENEVASTATAAVSAVVDRDIDDLQIRFSAPFTVEASVELAKASGDETPDAVRKATVGLAGLNLPGRRESDGSLRLINVLPGEHWLNVQPGLTGGYYLASVSLGGRDVTGQALNLQPGSPPIRVVYKPNAGTVSGAIDGTEGAAAILLPQESFDSHSPDYVRVCASGPGGTFEIESLKPGSYYAFAVNHLDPAKIYDPRTAQKIISSAARVQVTEGSAVSVKLSVIRLEE